MAEFAVQLTRPAARDLRSLPEAVHDGIIEGIMSLRKDSFPFPPSRKKLKGFGYPLCRLRAGDYRVLYRIDESIVTIMRVIDRKDLEKTLISV